MGKSVGVLYDFGCIPIQGAGVLAAVSPALYHLHRDPLTAEPPSKPPTGTLLYVLSNKVVYNHGLVLLLLHEVQF